MGWQGSTKLAGGVLASCEAVDVVILTRGRESLADAIASVVEQDDQGTIHILVLGDDAPEVLAVVKGLPLRAGVSLTAASISVAEQGASRSVWERVARLRNTAIAMTHSPLVAFLDDDNRWEPNHLSSLRAVLRNDDADAAHSWRRLCGTDGSPWVPDAYPWAPRGTLRERHLFQLYRKLGVFSDSPVVRDAASLIHNQLEYGAVDMGEWLLRRELIVRFPFETDFSLTDLDDRIGEDDKLLAAFRLAGASISCSKRATLHYRIGGFSNAGSSGHVACFSTVDAGTAEPAAPGGKYVQ